MTGEFQRAPELQISQWMNSDEDINLKSCLGKVVLIEAFQMLCPGCVEHGLPQAQKAQQLFSSDDLIVLGLHSVFEHHTAMGPESLKAFLYEYRITFPVGIDMPAGQGPIPKTMASYQLQGTPTLLLIDRQGRLRRQKFGIMSDLQLGAEIMALMKEQPFKVDLGRGQISDEEQGKEIPCDETGCRA
ncbi:alkyl hydroperoxide reductase [Kiloniella spongiae]|uniref:Alkyl hydroperoxide reductase n=1 Tax=Kiloniella spongiae TaxID=1489064 RepID=A0A0H2MIF2_9PROT|nr:redoxin domain-containing protein [Kiloniella spongiae]KLN61921.1 alkyl hydroperoxide reductase [Kiloniella spongiae]